MLKSSRSLARLACVKKPLHRHFRREKADTTGTGQRIFPLSRPVPSAEVSHACTHTRSLSSLQGGYYQVLTLASHTETGEQLVIYQSELDGTVYARPVAMFMEWIEHQGQVVSRFSPIK
ncbi:DUF1653 domain-containing protein [Aeromonas jandaei]|nr:DUF1653 domain-containing protein [Aeromonas jandaei]